MQHLMAAFEGGLARAVVISNQDKGLHLAVSKWLPNAEHRVCMRHYWKSFMKNFPGDLYEQTIWDAARSFSRTEFIRHMEKLARQSMPAVNEILKMKAYKWSRHQFDRFAKNHYITSNLSESFDAWVLDARSLPAVELVDKMRCKMMEKLEQRRKLAAK